MRKRLGVFDYAACEPCAIGLPLTQSNASERRAAWGVLLGAYFAMFTSWNVVGITLSVFLVPMQAELGWSRTALSIAPLASLLSAFLYPVMGLLLERYGARLVAMGGTLAMAASLALFAVTPLNRLTYLGLIGVLAVSGATVNSVVLVRGIVPWFERNLGSAIGALLTAVSVALALIEPLMGFITAHAGWRAGFASFAAIAVLFSFPSLYILYREPPRIRPNGLSTDPMKPDAFRILFARGQFWQLGAACCIAALPIGGSFNHLVPLLISHGVAPVEAAGTGSVFAIALGVGAFVNGVLFDRTHPSFVAAITLGLAALGEGMLYALPAEVHPSSALLLAIALVGLASGAEGAYISYFSSRLFGVRNFARVVSLMAFAVSVGFSVGGFLFATAFDTWGSYRVALMGAMFLFLVASGIFLTLSMPPKSLVTAPNQEE